MAKYLVLAAVGLTLATTAPTISQAQRDPAPQRSATTVLRDLAYGPDPRQRLDYYPTAARRAPLIVYVHGGGWSVGDKATGGRSKPAHFNAEGYAFATINYRLVPRATVEEQAADVARSIAWLRSQARRLGHDPERIVLMGHSSGAHLAALVSSDPAYLKAARVPMTAVRATVLLDGAGYDVRVAMADGGPAVARFYVPAFGRDRTRQARLSPIIHAGAPNVANWLLLYDRDRIAAGDQADNFARALGRGGSNAIATAVPDTSHVRLNDELGARGDFATMLVDNFLRANVRYAGRPIPVAD